MSKITVLSDKKKLIRKIKIAIRIAPDTEIQVGSTCLKDFLGHSDPENIVSYIAWAQGFKTWLDDIDMDETSDYAGARGWQWYRMDDYMAHVAAVAEKHGYISKSKAAFDETPTADQASNNMTSKGKDWYIPVTDAQKELAVKMVEWGKEHFTENQQSDYDYNMFLILTHGDNTDNPNKDYFCTKYSGYLTSLHPTYMREMELLIRQQNGTSGYIGTVGDKMEFTGKVISVASIETMYGMCWITKFESLGHVVVAFMSKQLKMDMSYSFVDVEILEHGTFKGDEQTKIKISFRKKINREEASK